MHIGLHIKKNSNILDKKHKSVIIGVEEEVPMLGMSSISMFIIGPMNKNKISMNLQGISKYCKERDITIWPHGSYLTAAIWNVNHANRHENQSLIAIRTIKDHLVIGKQLSAKGIIVHLPRHTISDVLQTMEIISNCKVINSIRKNEVDLPKFTIECPASRPNEDLTYETAPKLNNLVGAIIADTKINIPWNLCIDSAHQYAGGIDFGRAFDEWESALSDETRARLALIHLNGASAKNFGTGKDFHIIPCSKEDAIWGHLISDEFRIYMKTLGDDIDKINGLNLYESMSDEEKNTIKTSTLYSMVRWAKKLDIDFILEINRGNYCDIKLIMDILNALSEAD